MIHSPGLRMGADVGACAGIGPWPVGSELERQFVRGRRAAPRNTPSNHTNSPSPPASTAELYRRKTKADVVALVLWQSWRVARTNMGLGR